MKLERFPNINRVSVVVATILLTYGLTQIINAPQTPQNFSIGGFLVPFSLNFSTLITFAVAAITASGTDWILRDHPELKDRSIIPHLFLPSIAAWAQIIILNNMPNTPLKWVVFLGGGVFLFIVILSEYIAIFEEDYRRLLAISLLTALSYGLFLTLTVALESANQRLIISIPAIAIGAGTLSMRVLQLQTQKEWPIIQAVASTLLISQIAAALHYLPISPLSHGLFLFAVLYFTINFNTNLIAGNPIRQAVIESIVPLIIISGFALWIS